MPPRLAILTLALLIAGPASAQDMDFSKIKCSDFIAAPKDEVGSILMWLEGFYTKQNAPPDRPTQITIDSGADLFGGGARTEEFATCDQYTLQGDAFSRVVLGEVALEYPIEDAIANMRVIDAVFRSGQSGRWEAP